MSPIAIVSSYVWVKGGERRLVYEQEGVSSFERPSYASMLQTSASGVSGLPLFWLRRGLGDFDFSDVR